MKKLIVFFIIICILSSCTEKIPSPVLTESEIAFNEKLASITKDVFLSHIYYIGTEDGLVFRYNSESNHIDTLITPYDRIYKVYHSDEETYWIGTRNQGLVRCSLVGDSLFKEEGAYTIPAKNKARKYSAYDILEQGRKTVVATSHGLFVIEDVADSAMHLLYPNIDKSYQDTLRPVVASKIQAFNESLIFCASDSGLLKFDMTKGTIATCIPIKPVKSLEIVGKEIRLLTSSYLCIVDKDGEIIDSVPKLYLDHPANTYFYERNEGVNYLIGERNAQLIKDDNWSTPSEHKNVRLKYKVRSSTCRNVIANDTTHHQSLMVSEHSIVRIGHHQNVFNCIGKVDHACVDDKFVYFLIGSKLYRQDTTEKNSLKAEHICNLGIKGKGVSFLEVLNGVVYYVSDDKKQIFKKELKNNFFINEFFSPENTLENMLGKEVTAIGKDRQNVYVGIRDGFQNVNQEETLHLYTNSISREICPDPFITAMTDTLSGGDILLGTLNDGLYRGKDNIFKRLTDFKESFIRDVAVNNDDNRTFVLTNRKLFVYGVNPDSVIIKEAQGYNRILIASHPYGIKEYGIHDFETNMDFFTDIEFNPQACVSKNGLVYAGSNNGVFVFDRLYKGGKESGYKIVDFGPEYEPFTAKNLILFGVMTILTILLGILWYIHYRKNKQIMKKLPTLLKKNQDVGMHEAMNASLERIKSRLNSRIQQLRIYEDFYDKKLRDEIEALSVAINQLDSHGIEQAQEEANRLNRDIQNVSFRIPSILNKRLDEQIQNLQQEVSIGDEIGWIKETNIARNGSDVELKAKLIRENAQRLEHVKDTAVKLAEYRRLFKDVVSIPMVTEECIKILNSNEIGSFEKIKLIEEQLEHLNSPETREKVAEYLKNRCNEVKTEIEKLERDSAFYQILLNIKNEYNDFENYIVNVSLNALPIPDRHFEIIKVLLEINALIYKFKTEGIEFKEKQEKDAFREEITKQINLFYELVWNSRHERKLLVMLGIKEKKSDGQFLQANVLALLLANAELRNKELIEILSFITIYSPQRVRASRRDLMNLIELNRDRIKAFADNIPSSFAPLLLTIKK